MLRIKYTSKYMTILYSLAFYQLFQNTCFRKHCVDWAVNCYLPQSRFDLGGMGKIFFKADMPHSFLKHLD